jgi:ATP-dependent protease ClpP protease subunit
MFHGKSKIQFSTMVYFCFMPKEILIYGLIHSYSVTEMMKAMADVEPSDEMLLRINTDGGQPQDGFGLAAKFAEFTGSKTIQVDGRAYSTGLFLLCYAETVNALDVSSFMVHRAGYAEWYERSEFFTPEVKANIVAINKDLERAFRGKIDVEKFEEIKGVSIKDIFDIDKPRTDVFFTAQEAKKIGLVNNITKITPTALKQINAQMHEIAAKYTGGEIHQNIVESVVADLSDKKTEQPQIKNSKKMNKQELLAAHPEICAELIADGAAKEKSRVDAWMVNLAIDANAVKTGIDGGGEFTQKDMAEFGQKQMAIIAKGGLEADSNLNKNINVDENNNNGGAPIVPPTEMDAISAKINAHLGINQ